jgi:hypothetical protein
MKKTRYTEEQIAFALRQAEAGTPVEDICRNPYLRDETSPDCPLLTLLQAASTGRS